MNERQYLKRKRQLELATSAMALQQQFSPEQETRERLAQEQSRAAYYANEAYKRNQPLLQREQAARVAMLEDDAKNYSARQALVATQQALQNAGMGEALGFQNMTAADRARTLQLSNEGVAAQTAGVNYDNEFARRAMQARVDAAQYAPTQAKTAIDAQRAQIEASRQQGQIAQEMLPAEKAYKEIMAMREAQQLATVVGPTVPGKDKDGKDIMTPVPADPRSLLPGSQYEDMRRRFEVASAGDPTQAAMQNLDPQSQRLLTELNNPALRRGLFEAIAQNRPYSNEPRPGTVQRGPEISSLLAQADAVPFAQMPPAIQALQYIRQNPQKFNMHMFDPSVLSEDAFVQALMQLGFDPGEAVAAVMAPQSGGAPGLSPQEITARRFYR